MDVFTKEKWHQTTLHLSFSLFEKKKKKMYMLFQIMILTTRGSSLVLVPLFTTAATSINNK